MGHSLNDKSFVINDKLIIDTGPSFNVPGNVLISDSKGNAKWKSPSGWSNPSAPLDRFIGEIYGGGVVVATWRETRGEINGFYEMCLVSSFKNISTTQSWSSIINAGIGATAQYFSAGASCSLAIVGQSTAVTGAARMCVDYVNEDLGGLGIYTDWYLPAPLELNCLSNNATVFNRVVSQYVSDKSINSGSYSLFLNSDRMYWTSAEYGTGEAISLKLGTSGALLLQDKKSVTASVRPFRTDIRRWNGIDGVWTELSGPGTVALRQYQYMIATYYYSFYDTAIRDLDTASFITGSGLASTDNIGLGYYNNIGLAVPIGTTQGSCYMYWGGDDVQNGKGESILFNFENMVSSGSNVNVTGNLYAAWYTLNPASLPASVARLTAIELTTYNGGSLYSPTDQPNTIVSTGTVVQRLRYQYFSPPSTQSSPVSSGMLVAVVNYNLTTKVSTVTFY